MSLNRDMSWNCNNVSLLVMFVIIIMQELCRDVIPKCLFRFRCNDGVKSCFVSVFVSCSVARILSIRMIAECSVRLKVLLFYSCLAFRNLASAGFLLSSNSKKSW